MITKYLVESTQACKWPLTSDVGATMDTSSINIGWIVLINNKASDGKKNQYVLQ